MSYSIGEFSQLVGLSADTLRYYEKENLIYPNRDKNNRRVYTDEDKSWLLFILRLKETAMPIKQIKTYARLRYEGDKTSQERMHLLLEHRKFMLEQRRTLDENIDHLNRKIANYQKQLNERQGIQS
ncbi:MerR family transcriptional regulator [Sporolactobacillus shoreicorticis]|uniref:MerR family transcriptional regulator n=1 Tax=Sporolactobacillus shoreicorticis TaxID=1923877 RepID=A0ABW5RZP1_9BACL|nr:MerR family transcriptional regulator [Sporolactobacillus shoreicorticis]MCO7127217.1 MerR family transcriptional regulator [Sporolactobacillus shoreicorticis]